jgi:hypothetical protein
MLFAMRNACAEKPADVARLDAFGDYGILSRETGE